MYFIHIYINSPQSQKLNGHVVRLQIFVVPAAGMVHPTCKPGALE